MSKVIVSTKYVEERGMFFDHFPEQLKPYDGKEVYSMPVYRFRSESNEVFLIPCHKADYGDDVDAWIKALRMGAGVSNEGDVIYLLHDHTLNMDGCNIVYNADRHIYGFQHNGCDLLNNVIVQFRPDRIDVFVDKIRFIIERLPLLNLLQFYNDDNKVLQRDQVADNMFQGRKIPDWFMALEGNNSYDIYQELYGKLEIILL